jgi:hypothetical protein
VYNAATATSSTRSAGCDAATWNQLHSSRAHHDPEPDAQLAGGCDPRFAILDQLAGKEAALGLFPTACITASVQR